MKNLCFIEGRARIVEISIQPNLNFNFYVFKLLLAKVMFFRIKITFHCLIFFIVSTCLYFFYFSDCLHFLSSDNQQFVTGYYKKSSHLLLCNKFYCQNGTKACVHRTYFVPPILAGYVQIGKILSNLCMTHGIIRAFQ